MYFPMPKKKQKRVLSAVIINIKNGDFYLYNQPYELFYHNKPIRVSLFACKITYLDKLTTYEKGP